MSTKKIELCSTDRGIIFSMRPTRTLESNISMYFQSAPLGFYSILSLDVYKNRQSSTGHENSKCPEKTGRLLSLYRTQNGSKSTVFM